VQGHERFGVEHVEPATARPTKTIGDVGAFGPIEVITGDDPGRDQPDPLLGRQVGRIAIVCVYVVRSFETAGLRI
jgi:hypothetical protein